MAAPIRKAGHLGTLLKHVVSLSRSRHLSFCLSRPLTTQIDKNKSSVSLDLDVPDNANRPFDSYSDYLDTGRPFTDNVSEHETTIQEETKKSESFASLFRNSRLVQLGDLHRKILAGRIFQVINDDLYIDFGGKFMCVCNRPAYQPEKYTKGVRVRLFLNSFEMASSFMGSKKAVTLLEADCVLLGIFSPDSREERRQKSEGIDQSSPQTEKLEGLRRSYVQRPEATSRGDVIGFKPADLFDDEQYEENEDDFSEFLKASKELENIGEEEIMETDIKPNVSPLKFDDIFGNETDIVDMQTVHGKEHDVEEFHGQPTDVETFHEQSDELVAVKKETTDVEKVVEVPKAVIKKEESHADVIEKKAETTDIDKVQKVIKDVAKVQKDQEEIDDSKDKNMGDPNKNKK